MAKSTYVASHPPNLFPDSASSDVLLQGEGETAFFDD